VTELYAEAAPPERAVIPSPAVPGPRRGGRTGGGGKAGRTATAAGAPRAKTGAAGDGKAGRSGTSSRTATASGRKAGRSGCTPRRNPDFEGVRLTVLRSYRSQLRQEECRVSYWRRIVHARLDLVRAVARRDGGPARLRTLLSTSKVGSGRRALLTLHPVGGMPPLPDLAEMWDRVVRDGDDDGRDRLLADLQHAERQLSDYRRALHVRLDAATAELIARYAEDPSLCLTVLPGARAS